MAALRSARIAARSSVQCAERGRSFTPAPMSTWWSAVSARCRSQPAPQETTRSRLQSFSAAVARTNDRKCARARSDSPMSVDWESVRFIAHQCAYLFAQPTLTFAALRATKVVALHFSTRVTATARPAFASVWASSPGCGTPLCRSKTLRRSRPAQLARIGAAARPKAHARIGAASHTCSGEVLTTRLYLRGRASHTSSSPAVAHQPRTRHDTTRHDTPNIRPRFARRKRPGT